jgi:hypothetical protein
MTGGARVGAFALEAGRRRIAAAATMSRIRSSVPADEPRSRLAAVMVDMPVRLVEILPDLA